MCALSLADSQEGYGRDNPSNQLNYNPFGQLIADENELNGDEIPGEPGRDYPVYAEPPKTSFRCDNQQFPGYYADPEAQCQAFYICQKGGRSDAFLCPNGTIFNQEFLVCDWWYNFDCNRAESLYSLNEQIVRDMEEADERIRLEKEQAGYDYNSQQSQNGGYKSGGTFAAYQNGRSNEEYQNGGSNEGYQNGGANGVYQNGGINAAYQNSGNNGGYKNEGFQNGGSNGRQKSVSNISPVYGLPNSDFSGLNSRQRNEGPSQNYGAPRQTELINNGNGKKNGNGRKPSASYGAPENQYSSNIGGNRNGYNGNGRKPSTSYGVPEKQYSSTNGGNGFNGNGNGYTGNGNGYNGNGKNGYQNGNSRNNLEKSHLPPNFGNNNGGNGNLQAYRNGLGNGPSVTGPSSFGQPGRIYLPV